MVTSSLRDFYYMIVYAGVYVCIYAFKKEGECEKEHGVVRKERRERGRVRETSQNFSCANLWVVEIKSIIIFKNNFMIFYFIVSAYITFVNRKIVYKDIYVVMSSK